MKISEFIALLNTTKETVRHYEDLNLVTPKRVKSRREYGQKEVLDFQVILELKGMGLSLKDIQLLFDLKRAIGCGEQGLVREVILHLTNHLEMLRNEEDLLRERRMKLEKQLEEVKLLLV
ncbi:6-phosphogluconolactonase [Cohnella kolymensis]|uniref:6-phosphogluconolactonase n=1 Tax=Cohnella kolymensis TaxID=1590652 RepID=A0ABR4ZZY6_9BACL|nr:MerR family transcriptional regulator [Cohnella kolymensis]KIL34384.1 6-phosphogluconolactonase [Cohnella kolymensis]